VSIRRAAVAGSWYPGSRDALVAAVDRCLAQADAAAAEAGAQTIAGDIVALVAPHAGLVYSGSVAAHSYRHLRGRRYDVVVLVGPSHFVAFEGVAVFRGEGFETPLGTVPVDGALAAAIAAAAPMIHERPDAHAREHSLEMQLPFLQRLAPGAPIVPLVMGRQRPETARALADALAAALRGRTTLMVASTDLSHFNDAATAWQLDSVVIDHVQRRDADGLQTALDRRPEHACGGGPTVAVMRAAGALGANRSAILHYADSGDVSMDKSSVVGYCAAAFYRG
jgi:AmmeMemoRadiSam system protein B